jgi:hypothetical protein
MHILNQSDDSMTASSFSLTATENTKFVITNHWHTQLVCVRILVCSFECVSVAITDTNMLVNCWMMTQFKSNCLLLANKYHFETVSGNNILLGANQKKNFPHPLKYIFLMYYMQHYFKNK